MENKKEELAEYVIKNLTFIVLFCFVMFYTFSTLILPRVNEYKAKKGILHYTQLSYAKALEQNTLLNEEIQRTQEENKKNLSLLQSPPSANKIQALAQKYFEVDSLKQIRQEKEDGFMQKTFKIQGRIQKPENFFAFSKELKVLYPNVTLLLPLEIKKKNPLDLTLELNFHFKMTQIDKK